jgi:hypothetical protein
MMTQESGADAYINGAELKHRHSGRQDGDMLVAYLQVQRPWSSPSSRPGSQDDYASNKQGPQRIDERCIACWKIGGATHVSYHQTNCRSHI